ncbi:MAG: anthranilate synthase component I family protein [Pseudomonadota bacterium]
MTDPLILDWCAPAYAFAPLVGEPGAHLFHGGEGRASARWSFIVAAPASEVTLQSGVVFINGAKTSLSLVAALRQLQDALRASAMEAATSTVSASLSPPDTPPFTYGLAGFMGYEAAAVFEPSLVIPPSPFDLPDVCFGAYEAVAAFDRQKKRVLVHGVSKTAIGTLVNRLDLKTDQSDSARDQDERDTSQGDPFLLTDSQCNFSRATFMDAVNATRDAILRGDIFQANITRQIAMRAAAVHGTAFEAAFAVYGRTVAKTDASHAAFLQGAKGIILSNSPERFFCTRRNGDNQLHVRVEPIKGTIARGKTPEADAALADALRTSEKDRAENIMIADLLRNDLSRVCLPESVREDDICAILSLTYVHHLVSRISGTLVPGLDSFDALAALFPCGSITGAPKIEAMTVIAAREKIGRGPYCGAIGYMNHDGSSDFSVAIRTMMIDQLGEDGACRLTMPVGGGITLNSNPAAEYEETVLKALGLSTGLSATLSPDQSAALARAVPGGWPA